MRLKDQKTSSAGTVESVMRSERTDLADRF